MEYYVGSAKVALTYDGPQVIYSLPLHPGILDSGTLKKRLVRWQFPQFPDECPLRFAHTPINAVVFVPQSKPPHRLDIMQNNNGMTHKANPGIVTQTCPTCPIRPDCPNNQAVINLTDIVFQRMQEAIQCMESAEWNEP